MSALDLAQFQANLTWNALFLYGVLALITYMVYCKLIKPFLSPLRKLPGLGYNPIFGNVREAMQGRKNSGEMSMEWTKKYGGILRFYHLMGQERVLISDPAYLKYILVTNAKNYERRPQPGSLIYKAAPQGLFFIDGDYHRQQKAIMQPSFRGEAIKGMVSDFQDIALQLANLWEGNMRKEEVLSIEVDAQRDLTRTALDIICKCGFGYMLDSISYPDKEEVKALAYLTSFQGLGFSQLLPFLSYLPFKGNRLFWKYRGISDTLVYSIIEQKRKELEHKDDVNQHKTILDIIMRIHDAETGQGFTDKELHDHVITFLVAGHETSSVAMSWTLLKLAEFPEIQEKVRQEINNVLPPRGQEITWEHLEQLTYLTCVIKESLRLYPIVIANWRRCINDDKIGPYHIPGGTVVLYHIGALMRNPKYWPDPEEYKPDRFLNLSEEAKLAFTFLPFITGPHACIGKYFAMAEMKMAISVLVRNFEFLPIPGVVHKRKMTGLMRPDPPVRLRVTKLEH